ncbi:MAG: uroporphyrinogen-III synthase [Gammaproteobacteria bacterium]|nr:uroporphyrinogen-III synthase [Gammaproteobacteria bacterium]
MPKTELSGLTILVTRPAHQAAPLCRLIEAAGGEPLRLPALVIHDNGDDPALRQRLAHLSDYQIAIFVSPNAVTFGLDAIRRSGGLLDSLLLATVGKGSANALCQQSGRRPDLVPRESYDSEALLQLEPLQHVSGKRILIIRGSGGRELLAETLRQRGARVDYAEVYRRAPPPPPADTQWLKRTDIITLTSGEALGNLVTLTPQALRDTLYEKPLVVVSERAAQRARQLGFRREVLVTPLAGDAAIVATLIEWAQRPVIELEKSHE